MNYIRFIRKRVNVIVYFGSKPNTDWDMIKVCQSMKETHKFRFDGATKEWYLSFRMDDFDPVLDNISSYDNLLDYFDNTQKEKFTTFLKVKNKKYYEQIQDEKEKSKERTKNYLNRIVEYNHLNLYNHQKEDVQVLSKNESTILGNEMGTGKSRSSIVYSEIQDFNKILIVCPASLKLNWKKEILMVNPSADICILPEESPMPYTKYYIINYDILIKEFTFEKNKVKKNKINVNLKEKSIFNKIKFDVMFIDEAQYIKNDSKRTRATLYFVDHIPHIIPISGTPIKSKVKDVYNLLLAIKHPLTKNGFFPFAQKYCGAYYNGFGWTYDGASNLEELYKHLKPYMIRKLKDECLDLPSKIVTEIYVKLSKEGQKEYETAFEDYINFVRNDKLKYEDEVTKNIVVRNIEYAEHLVKLNLLKQICSRDKLPLIYERIEDLLDEDEDRKVIVFSQYTDTIAKLYTRFKDKAVQLTGSTSIEKRQEAVDSFQNDSKIRVFIGQTIAGGVGITLTKADVVIMADLLWTPADHVQAEDRCILQGQLVLTKDGYKKIEIVNIGDYVYTHKGNWKKVINKSSHLERKKYCVDIRYKGFNISQKTTNDHEIFVYNKLENKYNWKTAETIDIVNDYITFPFDTAQYNDINYFEFNPIINEYFYNNFNIKQKNGRLKNINHKINITDDLLFAFGWYIAEGWSVISDKKSCMIGLCGNLKTEINIVNKVSKSICNAFNINNFSNYKSKNNTYQTIIYSKELSILFKNWFGENAYTKQIPDWMFKLSNRQLKILLNGYFKGDGYQRKNTQQASTSSSILASQLCILLAKLNNTITLRKLNNKYGWSFEYSIKEKQKRNSLIKVDNKNGYILFPIENISKYKFKRNSERVYDLTVEDDTSFIVGLSSIHNCHRIGQHASVNILYFIVKDSIEEDIFKLIQKKREIINKVIDNIDSVDENQKVNMLRTIIDNFNKKYIKK